MKGREGASGSGSEWWKKVVVAALSRQAATGSVPSQRWRAQPYVRHGEMAANQRRQVPHLPSTKSCQCQPPSCNLQLPNPYSRYQTGQPDERDTMTAKDKVIDASKRHPKPDHAFQYGTAGVSNCRRASLC
jgi:hypothetical protein